MMGLQLQSVLLIRDSTWSELVVDLSCINRSKASRGISKPIFVSMAEISSNDTRPSWFASSMLNAMWSSAKQTRNIRLRLQTAVRKLSLEFRRVGSTPPSSCVQDLPRVFKNALEIGLFTSVESSMTTQLLSFVSHECLTNVTDLLCNRSLAIIARLVYTHSNGSPRRCRSATWTLASIQAENIIGTRICNSETQCPRWLVNYDAPLG